MVADPLQRFVVAQQVDYEPALAQIRNGRKLTHWMWYIFPQLAGLGHSELATYYAIADLEEAKVYLAHPILGPRLVAIANALLGIEGKTARQILGSPDDLKLCSSMTLFSLVEEANPVFQAVLDKFFGGTADATTWRMVSRH